MLLNTLLQFLFSVSDPPISTYLSEEIGQRLIQLHSDPKAFWFGQFVDYLMRNNKMIDELIKNASKKIGLPKIYVG
jgi:hypothetical protein